jgi:hypothetical protein
MQHPSASSHLIVYGTTRRRRADPPSIASRSLHAQPGGRVAPVITQRADDELYLPAGVAYEARTR